MTSLQENLEYIKKLHERSLIILKTTVDEVMSKDVITIDYYDPCAKAARIILENGFLSLLVMKEGKPYNTVSVFELLRLGYEETFSNKDYLTMNVGELIVNKKFYYLPSGTLLRDAINFMMERKLRTIPIITNDVVNGILSIVDIVQWYRLQHSEVLLGKVPK
ncbi:MAG: CBS domain-containing protein [Leptospiraceae bacterium]|nr:CBS domain-containing protein [Leptospiraceae bacterium]MDW7976597.1 CBS domain-containing protein [Leptospiraceae bacterium]